MSAVVELSPEEARILRELADDPVSGTQQHTFWLDQPRPAGPHRPVAR
ncbi:hypothetical protein [Thermobifida halotolerans]|nr:hypothetical protein [Thermobifida halotolerans]